MIQRTRLSLVCIALLAALAAGGCGRAPEPASPVTAPSGPPAGVSAERFARLERGVNIPHWFWLPDAGGADDHFRSYITAEDVALISDLGLGHVRIPVDMAYLFEEARPEALIPDRLDDLDAGIARFLDQDVAVIVAPFGQIDDLVDEPERVEASVAFWELLAAHLRKFDPELLFVQVANEPRGATPEWAPIQERLLAAIRGAMPEHTLITALPLKAAEEVNGAPEALAALTPLSDQNLVYNFHFYEPYFFTLQGASWTDPWVATLREIPYPSDEATMELAAQRAEERIDDDAFRDVPDRLRYYGQQPWDRERIAERVDIAADWAEGHGVRVIVDEFGVYKDGGVRDSDRLVWLADVRAALESRGIGWTMWDYSGNFRLVESVEGRRVPDLATAMALGLYP